MVLCKTLRRLRPQAAVIAPLPFGNIMKKGSQIQDPRALKLRGDVLALRNLLGELGHKKAPHIRHNQQDVLIDGIGVHQIVLHLPHGGGKAGQIVRQKAAGIHAPQQPRDASGRLQAAQKRLAAADIGAKICANLRLHTVKSAQRVCAKAHNFWPGLVQGKGLPNPMRLSGCSASIAQDQITRLACKIGIQHLRRAARQQPFLQAQQSHF